MHMYYGVCDNVVDGDTVDVIVDLGFSIYNRMRLRLADIDTPELRDKDSSQRMRAMAAKQFVIEKLMDRPKNDRIQIQTRKTRSGKERQTFGRYVADIWYEDEEGVLRNLGDVLIEERMAVRSEW